MGWPGRVGGGRGPSVTQARILPTLLCVLSLVEVIHLLIKLYAYLYCSFIISSVYALFHKPYYLQSKMGYSLI